MKRITIEILNDEDFKVGQFVTVVESACGDMSFIGDVLEITAIDLPERI